MVDYDTQVKGKKITFICSTRETSPPFVTPPPPWLFFSAEKNIVKSVSHPQQGFHIESYSLMYLFLFALLVILFPPSLFFRGALPTC